VSETSIDGDQLPVTRKDIARRLSVGHTTIWEPTSRACYGRLRAVETAWCRGGDSNGSAHPIDVATAQAATHR
jgi:hypothetical protein